MGIPVVPTVVAVIIAFLREAPLWFVAVMVIAIYLLTLAGSVFVLKRVSPRRQTPATEPVSEEVAVQPSTVDAPTSQAAAAQPGDEELKRRSRELADELFQFLDERGEQDPQHTRWIAGATDDEINEFSQAAMQYSNETMREYRRRFSGRVRALVAELKQRSWWDLEDVNPKERKRLENPLHPISVQAIAERLSEIGYKYAPTSTLKTGTRGNGPATYRVDVSSSRYF